MARSPAAAQVHVLRFNELSDNRGRARLHPSVGYRCWNRSAGFDSTQGLLGSAVETKGSLVFLLTLPQTLTIRAFVIL